MWILKISPCYPRDFNSKFLFLFLHSQNIAMLEIMSMPMPMAMATMIVVMETMIVVMETMILVMLMEMAGAHLSNVKFVLRPRMMRQLLVITKRMHRLKFKSLLVTQNQRQKEKEK